MIKVKIWIKIIFFVIILYFLVTSFNSELFLEFREGNTESLRESFNDNIFLLLSATFLIMIVQNIFTVIPLILLVSINVAFFGVILGFVWSWLTSVIGSMVIFLAIRYCFQTRLIEKVNENIKSKIESHGFKFVFLARIIPVLPTGIINIAAGISSISFRNYILATIIGNMIYILVLTMIPIGLINVDVGSYLSEIVAIILILILVLYRPVRKRRERILHFLGLKREHKEGA